MDTREASAEDKQLIIFLTELAGLELTDEGSTELAAFIPALKQDYAALRQQPIGLEPHVVFDPRWD